jgi:hypothetical protein
VRWRSLRTKSELLSPHLVKRCGGKIGKPNKINNIIFKWWGWEDSNFQPNDYQLLASEVPEVSGFVCTSALSPQIAD